jgi:DNA-binding XRE family transcriptional regulator
LSKYWIEDVTDYAGTRYWILFTHGMFHAPTAVIDDVSMRNMAEKVLGIRIAEIEAIHDAKLPEAVANYRKRAGMTQQELADAAGVSRTNLSNIERGRGNPTDSTRRKLMRAIGRAVYDD